MEAGFGRQLNRQLAFGRIHFLVEEHVDAKRIDAGIAHGDIGRQVRLGAQGTGRQVTEPFELGQ